MRYNYPLRLPLQATLNIMPGDTTVPEDVFELAKKRKIKMKMNDTAQIVPAPTESVA